MMKFSIKTVSVILTAMIVSGAIPTISGIAAEGIGRIEAEDMTLSGYIIKDAPLASNGKVIQIGGTSDSPIFQSAAVCFNGKDGKYDIIIGYPDVYSGSSTRKLYINGKEISIWAGNKTPGASVFGTTPTFDADTFKIKKINNVELSNGDKLELISRNDYGERGEFDYIEILPAGESAQESSGISFTDVEKDYWGYEDIRKMSSQSVVNGYDDGSFRPENNIKADEFLKMFTQILGYSACNGTPYWAEPYIDKAKKLGLLDKVSLEDYTVYIKRGEIIDIFSTIDALNSRISDIIRGDENGNISPEKNATRAEVVAILGRVQIILDNEYIGLDTGETEEALYELDKDGYVKTWCATGMVSTQKLQTTTVNDYQEFNGAEPEFDIPNEKAFDSVLPNGLEFIPKSIGSNVYVMETIRCGESDGVYGADGYLATDLVAESDVIAEALFRYQTGYYDLWCNGEKIANPSWKYTPTQSVKVSLNLKKGTNRIFVRVRNNGTRNCLSTVGLQIMTERDKIKTTLPLDKKLVSDFYGAEQWLNTISVTDEGNLKAGSIPIVSATVTADSKVYKWPKYEAVMDFDTVIGSKPMYFDLSLTVGETGMVRKMQVRNSVDYSNRNNTTTAERRQAYEDYLYENKVSEGYCLGSQLTLKYKHGEPVTDTDKQNIISELKSIDSMMDCSDFNLSHMIRLYKLYGDKFDDEIKTEYKHTLTNFAYWSDEEDSGRMVVGSENHKIGFYSSMVIAGTMFPNDIFSRSKRTGKQQAEIGLKRIEDWIATIERDGFEEYQSSAYMDVTLAGMLNTYDFIDSLDLKARMGKLIDLLMRMTAVNTFEGVSVGTQGRVYREIIDTESCIKQRMAGYISSKVALFEPTLWMVPLITSGYVIPEDVETLIENDADLHFIQGGSEVVTRKRKDYFMSLVNLPSSYKLSSPLAADVEPGKMLKQFHIMEVAIDSDARTFITHPGAAVDNTGQRPDYWYGQLTAPVSKMDNNMIMMIYNIPETSATQFTHAYWTSDKFDQEIFDGNWVFAKRNDGYIALWCSEKLEKFDDLLLNRELRANNPKTAWICIASSADESGSFEEFINNCKAKNISFDSASLVLKINDATKLRW